MWYLYLRRDQHYLRSYRTHNLWLDNYAKKMRNPKIATFHVAFMRKMAKSVSGVSLTQSSCKDSHHCAFGQHMCLSTVTNLLLRLVDASDWRLVRLDLYRRPEVLERLLQGSRD